MIATVIRSGKTCVALWTSTKINKNYLFGENQSTLLHRNPPFFTDFPSSIENYRVESKQKYKKQPLADASASHQGFFAVKRRVVFVLGAMWIALVRGWVWGCVVGGMETRFRWRKTHNHTPKCEAFHIAPRLFFMFLFLIPFATRQRCTIIFHWYVFPVGANKNGTPKALIDAFGVLWWGDMSVVTNYWRRLGNNSR